MKHRLRLFEALAAFGRAQLIAGEEITIDPTAIATQFEASQAARMADQLTACDRIAITDGVDPTTLDLDRRIERADGLNETLVAAADDLLDDLDNITAPDRAALRVGEAMRQIYAGILGNMRRDGYRVFDTKYKLSKLRMLSILASCRLLS